MSGSPHRFDSSSDNSHSTLSNVEEGLAAEYSGSTLSNIEEELVAQFSASTLSNVEELAIDSDSITTWSGDDAASVDGDEFNEPELLVIDRQQVDDGELRRRIYNDDLSIRRAAIGYNPILDFSNHRSLMIKPMDKTCRYCGARKFQDEPSGLCCNGGTVDCPEIIPPPDAIGQLFMGEDAASRHFLDKIRYYNNCFQMTSFGVSRRAQVGGFNSTFRIQGQIYHRIGSFQEMPDTQPSYLQIYFMGCEDSELNRRMSPHPNILRRNSVLQWMRLLKSSNLLYREFRSTLDRLPSDDSSVRILAQHTPIGEHPGRYNAPRDQETAVVVIDNGQGCSRDIVLHRRNRSVLRINELHPSYDALQYPIIFWQGLDTFNIRMAQVNPQTRAPNTLRKVTALAYYSYQLMIRLQRSNFLLRCRGLLNQFIVDVYVKIEQARLNYLRFNQSALRAENYANLQDAMNNDADPNELGQRVILPSTFIGGPRHMHEYAQDEIAYVRLFGRPDLFITFTCSPNWAEIQNLLFPGQKAIDRHDIVARVFRQKLILLMNAITKFHILGKQKCFMYSLEWQKRGLPHVHILLWLEERIRPEEIDSVISAEILDPNIEPVLHQIIRDNMIHGPCGPANFNSPCMDPERRTCTKRFPRAFTNVTLTGSDGYPLYRRRSPENGGQSFVLIRPRNPNLHNFVIDNRWVVPHNPTLSRMLKAHINVEYCHSVKSVQYICKYVNKGSDMATIQIRPNINRNDEITLFQTGRYLSTNEAIWRIFSFPIHKQYPPVQHLAVHLPNGQRVYFNPANAASRAENPPETTLTAFFTLCQNDEFARGLLYSELPRHYVFNKSGKIWTRRRRDTSIGRIYSVHPNNHECFYLRFLLHHVRGPQSFEDLRTHDAVVWDTYRQACISRGLLERDSHWDHAMQEAIQCCSASHVRRLFATILSECQPDEPHNLWDRFKEAMSEDILYEMRQQDPDIILLDFNDDIFNRALILIEDITLRTHGKTLRDLGINISIRRDMLDLRNIDILREQSYDRETLRSYLRNNYPILVSDQKRAFDEITAAIRNGEPKMFFLDAPGGTGKTFVLNLILSDVRQRGQIALAVASSGIASTLLQGGRTAHSMFKIPLDIERSEHPICNITRGSSRGLLLAQCKVIVWDECTMAHKKSLEALNATLKVMRPEKGNLLMAGVVVVLAGDFRQTLPVVPRSTQADQVNACLKKSFLWPFITKIQLRTNMRVHVLRDPNSEGFSDKLLRLGEGRIQANPMTNLINFPPRFCRVIPNIDQLVDIIFPDLELNIANMHWLRKRAILAPLNSMVSDLNNSIQQRIPGGSTDYLSIDSVVDQCREMKL